MVGTSKSLNIKDYSYKREVTALRLLVELAEEKGISSAAILKGTRVDQPDIDNPYFEIEVWQELAAIRNFLEHVDDPAAGIASGLKQHLTCYGTLGFAMMSSRNLKQALDVATKFHNISLWINEVSVVRENDMVRFIILGHKLPEFSQHFLATRGMAALVMWVTELIGKSITPSETTFRIGKPSTLDAFEHCFGENMLFGAEHYSIAFPRPLFHKPLKFRDRWSRMRSENELKAVLNQRRSTVANKVKGLLLELSDQKLSSEPAVCEALGYSMSTLRRRLHEENSSFRQIQSEVIHERACRLLLSSSMTVDQIAYALGYSESGSFGRAFKRQSGVSPGNWRRLNSGDSTSSSLRHTEA